MANLIIACLTAKQLETILDVLESDLEEVLDHIEYCTPRNQLLTYDQHKQFVAALKAAHSYSEMPLINYLKSLTGEQANG